LARVRRSRRLLDPTTRVKIARMQVYAIIGRSLLTVWSNRALDWHYQRLLKRVQLEI
jgi:hypothetical protein